MALQHAKRATRMGRGCRRSSRARRRSLESRARHRLGGGIGQTGSRADPECALDLRSTRRGYGRDGPRSHRDDALVLAARARQPRPGRAPLIAPRRSSDRGRFASDLPRPDVTPQSRRTPAHRRQRHDHASEGRHESFDDIRRDAPWSSSPP